MIEIPTLIFWAWAATTGGMFGAFLALLFTGKLSG